LTFKKTDWKQRISWRYLRKIRNLLFIDRHRFIKILSYLQQKKMNFVRDSKMMIFSILLKKEVQESNQILWLENQLLTNHYIYFKMTEMTTFSVQSNKKRWFLIKKEIHKYINMGLSRTHPEMIFEFYLFNHKVFFQLRMEKTLKSFIPRIPIKKNQLDIRRIEEHQILVGEWFKVILSHD